MVISFIALLLPALALSVPTDPLDKAPEIQICGSQCEAAHEAACKEGCKFAYALLSAPVGYAHNPSCFDGCGDAYAEENDRVACRKGCTHFQKEARRAPLNAVQDLKEPLQSLLTNGDENESPLDPLPARMMNIMRNIPAILSSFFHGEPDGSESNQDKPLVMTRVRFFFFPKPEENDDDRSAFKLIEGEPIANAFGSLNLPSHQDGQTELKTETRRSSICHKFVNRARDFFGNPIHLGLTMSALMLLLIVQFVLCLHRRPRRSRGHDYARLPTYTEAVQIKVPYDEVEVFKPAEKSKPLDADA